MNSSQGMNKKLPPKVSEMTENQLKIFLAKKREGEKKAQHVIVSLCEIKLVSDELLIAALPLISPAHWDTLAEERALLEFCGSPLCPEQLKPLTSKQQYSISLKTNKVYDVTFRKNFCSGQCYKNFTFIKNQIPTDPLWWRDESEIGKFVLRPPNGGSTVGDEVDISLYKKIDKTEVNETFDSILDFTKASIADIEAEEETTKPKKSSAEPKPEPKPKQTKSTPFIIGDVVEKRSENRVDPMISAGQKLLDKKPNVDAETTKPFVEHVEMCLGEWLTLESLLFLEGEDKVKKSLANKGNRYRDSSIYKQIFNSEENEALEHQKMPQSSYSILKEENKLLEVKVSAFFRGEIQIPVPDEPEPEAPKEEDENNQPKLPLVDKTAQNEIRKRILLDSLNKALEKLCPIFGISPSELKGNIRTLVHTFHLEAYNITMKPSQWTLAALILLKLISRKDKNLEKCLTKDISKTCIKSLLVNYKQDDDYLERLVKWLFDVDRLFNEDDKQP